MLQAQKLIQYQLRVLSRFENHQYSWSFSDSVQFPREQLQSPKCVRCDQRMGDYWISYVKSALTQTGPKPSSLSEDLVKTPRLGCSLLLVFWQAMLRQTVNPSTVLFACVVSNWRRHDKRPTGSHSCLTILFELGAWLIVMVKKARPALY